jgi:hypothetical protein
VKQQEMVKPKPKVDGQKSLTQDYYLRKLAKSGSSRYLSISTILPRDWEAVKVYVDSLSPESCTLRIIPIK